MLSINKNIKTSSFLAAYLILILFHDPPHLEPLFMSGKCSSISVQEIYNICCRLLVAFRSSFISITYLLFIIIFVSYMQILGLELKCFRWCVCLKLFECIIGLHKMNLMSISGRYTHCNLGVIVYFIIINLHLS